MKIHIFATLLFISCIPFIAQARGLRLANFSGSPINFSSNQITEKDFGAQKKGTISNETFVDFAQTPTQLAIKTPTGSIWFPLEAYLLKLHVMKKAYKPITDDGEEITGRLEVEPSRGLWKISNFLFYRKADGSARRADPAKDKA